MPTLAEIEAARTPAGGWTAKTLAGWGVPWPPPKGWKRALANTTSVVHIAEELPPGFKILNDGPGREALVDDRTDEPAPVFATRDKAVETAWKWWREIYEPEQRREVE